MARTPSSLLIDSVCLCKWTSVQLFFFFFKARVQKNTNTFPQRIYSEMAVCADCVCESILLAAGAIRSRGTGFLLLIFDRSTVRRRCF